MGIGSSDSLLLGKRRRRILPLRQSASSCTLFVGREVNLERLDCSRVSRRPDVYAPTGQCGIIDPV